MSRQAKDAEREKLMLFLTPIEKGEGAMILCPELFGAHIGQQSGPRPKSITFRIGDTLHAQLAAIAEAYGLTLSDTIHRLLCHGVDTFPGEFEPVPASPPAS